MKYARLCAVLLLVNGFGQSAFASPAGSALGTLICQTAEGWTQAFHSPRKLECTLHSASRAAARYSAMLTSTRPEAGYLKARELVWTAEGPASPGSSATLAGQFSKTSSAKGAVLTGGERGAYILEPRGDGESAVSHLTLQRLP